MEDMKERPPPQRGAIIVDTNVLFDLRAEIPREFANGQQHHDRFIKTLPLLGKNGFDILIPEEVVFEITRHVVSEDGKSLKDVRPYLAGDKYHERKGFLHSFGQILQGKVPGVYIIPAAETDPDGTQSIINKIKQVMQKGEGVTSETRAHIRTLTGKHKLDDMADHAITQYVSDFTNNDPNTLIFDLSTDRRHEQVTARMHRYHPNVKILDISGFVKALQENGLLRQFGIEDRVPYQAIVRHMTKRHDEYLGGHSSSPSSFVDSSCKEGESHQGFVNDRPFAEQIKGLAEDLGIEKPELSKPNSLTSRRHSRISDAGMNDRHIMNR